MTEPIRPEVMSLALLKEVQEAMISTRNAVVDVQSELEVIRKNQEPNTVNLKYEIDLSIGRVDEEIEDFTKIGLYVDTLTILKLPSGLSIKLTGISDESIDLKEDESITITKQKITRLLVTNAVGSGIAHIHAFGRYV